MFVIGVICIYSDTADEDLADLIQHIMNVKISEDDQAICRPDFETRVSIVMFVLL